MLATDATHTPRNSRRTGGGGARFWTEFTGACPQAASKAASTKNERTNRRGRNLGIGQQCKSDASETVAASITRHFGSVHAADASRADGVDPVMDWNGWDGWRCMAPSHHAGYLYPPDFRAVGPNRGP